ncbi:MAG TPA: hypothetical protein VII72_16005 [Myxococcota bacterium]|jgi:hypothetical protein
MIIGLIWAVFAPLLLVIGVWVLVRVARRASVPKPWRFWGPVIVVAGPTLALWIPERLAFKNHCDTSSKPTILETAVAEGFFLDDRTANSFGMRYLQEEGFSWVEARSIYHPGGFTRYEIVDRKIEQREIEQTSAEYTVRSNLKMERLWRTTETEIIDTKTGEKMAWANDSHFDGGTTKWVLGVYGTASCPDPRSTEGSEEFLDFYHLARNTLRPRS